MGVNTKKQNKKSVPRPGRMIYNEAEKFGKHIRVATRILWRGYIDADTFSYLADTFRAPVGLPSANDTNDLPLRAAWLLVNQWLYVRLWSSHLGELTFEDAERVFLAENNVAGVALSECFSDIAKRQSLSVLEALQLNQDFQDLLPYALDPYGPGSRASVMRDSSTASTRHRKRQNGVFFTPEDVAEYMVEAGLRKVLATGVSKPTVFDPACGTGVFLRVAFCKLIRNLGLSSEIALGLLHGTDICLQSIETCVFVLMHTLARIKGEMPPSPVCLWRQIRANFAVMDSCRLVREDQTDRVPVGKGTRTAAHIQEDSVVYETQVQHIHASNSPVVDEYALNKPVRLGDVFPGMKHGADLIVGNPPYNRLGHRSDRAFLKKQFACLSNGTWSDCAETYLLFVEMMWKLTNPVRGSAVLVVPMSLSYNTNVQFKLCRKVVECQGGTWQFAFFDREPHALFGEDVKTRNAIVFYHRHTNCIRAPKVRFQVTGLRRWTSRNRVTLFRSLQFTDVPGISIEEYIPKLSSDEELRNYTRIKTHLRRLSDSSVSFSSKQLSDIDFDVTTPVVYVSRTAYNFLNVFRALGPNGLKARSKLSTNAVHALCFASEEEAQAGYGALSSRMAYWLWRVIGDGFHVAQQFLRGLPFDMQELSKDAKHELAVLGQKLWLECLKRRSVNVNGGRTTFAFRPVLDSPILTRIDEILVKELALTSSFAEVLRAYVYNLVVMEDAERLHLLR